MNCFNCGKPLKIGSIRCPHCGYMPNEEFARRCPNLQGAVCSLTRALCKYLGVYQTCPIKNEGERECGY